MPDLIHMSITDDEARLIKSASEFARDYVKDRAAAWEREKRMPVDAIKAASKLGLTSIEVPKTLGGQGASFVAKLLVIEALSSECMAFAFSLINTQNVAARLSQGGTTSQRDRYLKDLVSGNLIGATALTEPSAGSDFAAIQTTATQTDGGWRLSGEKAWITNAAAADIFVVYAQTDPEQKWRGIASFLVDARSDGFERLPPYDLMGAHAIGTGGFRLNDFFVADGDLIAGPGDAFRSAMNGINGARTYVAGMCNAMVDASLRHAIRYGRKREIFGNALLAHQGLRWKLSDVATNLEASKLLTYRAAQMIDTDEDAMLSASYAKKFAAEYSVGAISECIQFMGAEGLKSTYPLGRHMACAKVAAYTDGSTEIQNERIGANLEKLFGET